MSEENVEFVRRWYAHLPDLRDLDPAEDQAFTDQAFRDWLDEGFELRFPGGYPEGEIALRGREGFAQLGAILREAWAEWRLEPERFIDAGDRVVVFVRLLARGIASGAPVEVRTAHVVTIRDGRMTSAWVYADRLEALEAVGLRA
jgi:ketosteroid isomerase-like protein